MYTVGVVGATGAVGKEMVQVLFDRKFPVEAIRLFASEKSAGKTQVTAFGDLTIEAYSVERAQECDFVLLAVSGDFAKAEAKQIIGDGKTVVIDNSSAFRYDADIPLVIPEINPETIGKSLLIANPNCTTAILAVALYPIYKKFGLKKVIVSTYQATSGAGQPAMDELLNETQNYLDGKEVKNELFAYPIPFNLIPHIDVFQENGYTKEEMKVTWETRKIFGAPELALSCTAVRIPTLRAHSESVTIETEQVITVDEVREILAESPGVKLMDDTANKVYPMPLTAAKKYDTEVGRIRQNLIFGDHGLDFFVCGDQLLKGAALNAVQIAECVVAKRR